MSTIPRVWHYGLMAEYWAEFLPDAPEVPLLSALITRSGEPVLDLGCGTGRVLLPLLRAGIDVDALTQTYTREARLEKWVSGEMVAAENHVLRGSLYLTQELMLMLTCAGFADVAVKGGYTDEVATRYHDELVFAAVR